MTNLDMMKAVTDVKDEFILEADPSKPIPKVIPFYVRYKNVIGVAAAFVLVIGLSGLLFGKGFGGRSMETMSVMSQDVNTETAKFGIAAPSMAVGNGAPEEDMLDGAVLGASNECAAEEYAAPAASAEEDRYEELQYAIENEPLVWNGAVYCPQLEELLAEIPDGWNYEFNVESVANAVVYSENSLLEGYGVYLNGADHSCFYVLYDGGFQLYRK